MDPVEQMLLLFFAGALVGALIIGVAHRGPSGVENECANLRDENARLSEENEYFKAEREADGGEVFL